jgi:hypothetical protein
VKRGDISEEEEDDERFQMEERWGCEEEKGQKVHSRDWLKLPLTVSTRND